MPKNFYRLLVATSTSFFAGTLVQKTFDSRKKEVNTPNCADYLSSELLKHGWRPHEVKPSMKDLPPFFISHFKPALVGSIAYAFIQKGEDFFVLLNKQKRRFPDGKWKFVADMPCGFYNVRQDDLVHIQRVVQSIGKKRSLQAIPLTHEKIQAIAVETRNQLAHETKSTDKMPYSLIDITTNNTALRELFEETGYEPRNKKGVLLNHESINAGAYFYFRIAFVDCLEPMAVLPTLRPANEEGIIKSCWVNVRDIHFDFDNSGQLVSGWARLDDESLDLKPWDKTAANLAYAISHITNNRFGVGKDPGQWYEEPIYDGFRLK